MARLFSAFLSIGLVLLSLLCISNATTNSQTLSSRSMTKDATPKTTTFNGQAVPPLIELDSETYKDKISSGYWLVKAFSPWCPHCMHLAPKWQTLYEYYYTSKPPTQENTHDNFTTFYDLNFASLDCTAYGSACSEMNVRGYPTMILFKDGKEIYKTTNDKDIGKLAQFIEECLEIIKPGTRPKKEDLEYPKVGVSSFYPKSAHTSPSPNPDGLSYPFTWESFHKLQVQTLDPWLVKFYDPSCPHCRKMEASWKTMAGEMKKKLNIGEVNCAAEKKLCAKLGIQAYPTIKLLRGPEHIAYRGLRGLGDFLLYANSVVTAAQPVQQVSLAQFEELEKSLEVIFVYLYDHATTSEDFMALDLLPFHLLGHAKLVKSDDPALSKRFNIYNWPRLLVSRDGVPSYFEETAPHEMRNVSKVLDWMKTVWQPLVPELSAENARELMDDKLAVLAILSRDRKEQFALAKRELKAAALEWRDREKKELDLDRKKLRNAKQMRVEEASDRGDARALEAAKMIHVDVSQIGKTPVSFAWVDGVFWERWTRTTYGVSVRDDGEKVIINDQMSRRYWDTTSTGKAIVPSRTSMLETLNLVTQDPPGIPPKLIGFRISDWIIRVRQQAASRPWLAACTATSTLMLFIFILMKVRRRRRRGYGANGFTLLEEKVGTGNNGVANGKVD